MRIRTRSVLADDGCLVIFRTLVLSGLYGWRSLRGKVIGSRLTAWESWTE